MVERVTSVAILLAALFAVGYFVPVGDRLRITASLTSPEPIVRTYQEGDGQGPVSDTIDATITGKFTTGSTSRVHEYEADATKATLELKRSISGTPSMVETRRMLIKFPNLIGGEPQQVPAGTQIIAVTLKLTLSAKSEQQDLAVTVYRVTEEWAAFAPGYLSSPSWRQRKPSPTEEENLWSNPGVDQPVSSHPVPVASAVPLPPAANGLLSLDVTAALRAWLDGAPNQGVMIRFADELGPLSRSAAFYSSDWPEVSLRPALEVSYRLPAPPPTPPPAAEAVEPQSKPAPAPAPEPAPVPPPQPPSLAPTPAPQPPAVRPSPPPSPEASEGKAPAPPARPPASPPAPKLETPIPPRQAPEVVTKVEPRERPTAGLRRVIQNLWETIINWFR